jgi:hypothetical protein
VTERSIVAGGQGKTEGEAAGDQGAFFLMEGKTQQKKVN